MRTLALACVSLVLTTPAFAGAIDDQFAAGMGGIPFGMKLDDLIAVRPGGEQFFSTAPGERGYSLADEDPLFGIQRDGMRIQYHFDKDNRVRSVAIGLPYAMREQLLGQLLVRFGQYRKSTLLRTAVDYDWPADARVRIGVRASQDPKNGILEFWVSVTPRPDNPR
jgi:hypothetical protein